MSKRTLPEMGMHSVECLDPESHDELVINLPLPSRMLSPNRNETRPQSVGALMGLSRARREYRETCTAIVAVSVRQAGWRTPQRARVDLHFGYRRDPLERALPETRKFYRSDDPDNAVASAKMAIDSLTYGLAIVDDSWKHIELGAVTASDDEGPYLQISVKRLA